MCETTLRKTPASLPSHKRDLKNFTDCMVWRFLPFVERKTDDRSGSYGIEWYVDTCDFVFKSLWVKCERGPLMLDWVGISSRKKVFPSSNECLRRIKVCLSRETA